MGRVGDTEVCGKELLSPKMAGSGETAFCDHDLFEYLFSVFFTPSTSGEDPGAHKEGEHRPKEDLGCFRSVMSYVSFILIVVDGMGEHTQCPPSCSSFYRERGDLTTSSPWIYFLVQVPARFCAACIQGCDRRIEGTVCVCNSVPCHHLQVERRS